MKYPFSDIMTSVVSLHERFYGGPPTILAACRKFHEEVDEFDNEARLDLLNNKQAVCDEAADVLITVFGILYARGIDLPEFEPRLLAKLAKNDLKTPKTHGIHPVTGTIERIERLRISPTAGVLDQEIQDLPGEIIGVDYAAGSDLSFGHVDETEQLIDGEIVSGEDTLAGSSDEGAFEPDVDEIADTPRKRGRPRKS